MKRLIALAMLLLLVVTPLASFAQADTTEEALPDLSFTTTTLDGEPISSAIIKNYDLIVVNFWGEWCHWCIWEMPYVQQISEKYKNVLVLGVWKGNNMTKAKEDAAEAGVTYPLIHPADTLYEYMYTIEGWPTTFFFDRNGKQVGTCQRGATDFDGWDRIITERLAMVPKSKTYTVTLNPNGGTCSTASKQVTYGKAYGTMPVPTRKGYTFAGWWTAKTGGKKVTASTICYASGNYTLYARWTEGYTMTFNPNGGTVSPTTKVVKYGQPYGTLPTPTRAGYTFTGWWTAKTGGKQVKADTVCYASAGYTLYARWTAKKFVITLNPNGGECATKTKTVTYGQAYGTMPVPSPRTGYTFAGWYTAKTGGKKVTATTVCYASGNYTLYARWTPKTYTVTLNPNGGTCATKTKTVTYGQTYGTLPIPTRDGYVFAGWWTTQSTGGKRVYSTTTCYATGNYTLYARWWKN